MGLERKIGLFVCLAAATAFTCKLLFFDEPPKTRKKTPQEIIMQGVFKPAPKPTYEDALETYYAALDHSLIHEYGKSKLKLAQSMDIMARLEKNSVSEKPKDPFCAHLSAELALTYLKKPGNHWEIV